jgi:uncharacterized protein (TIGR03435 family)
MEGAHPLVVRNHLLRALIATAYNLNPKNVAGGPAWIDSEERQVGARLRTRHFYRPMGWTESCESLAFSETARSNRLKMKVPV